VDFSVTMKASTAKKIAPAKNACVLTSHGL